MEVIVVYITFPTIESARQIGTVLVEKQLAACVNLIPKVESIYEWDGETKNDQEVLALVKTTAGRFTQIEAAVKELHPYDTPEMIATEVKMGSESYLNWVQDQMTGHH
mgnify:CR=1 FL=1